MPRDQAARERRAAQQKAQGYQPRIYNQSLPSPLREARRRAELTQAELAELAGVPLRTVQRLEQGGEGFGVKLAPLYRLAWVLGVERFSEVVDPSWLDWGGPADEPDGPAPKL